ncbi:MAG: hypothetical protein NXH75_06570 [Halobacteriovoraceae bacterium]|nr:hypothetical protein [Halobacteriovoraceae bacterium]
MKKLILMALGFLSVTSNGYHIENVNSRVAITPERIKDYETIPNKELQDFCGRASSYIENFRPSLEQNNCLEDMINSRTCHSIKRIYKRLANDYGVIGTDLEPKLALSLHSPTFEELSISKIAHELGMDTDQIIKTTSLKVKRLKNLKTSFSNPGTFEMAMQVVGINPVIQIDLGEVLFNERLSACAFDASELAISGTVEVESLAIDSIPQSALAFLNRLKGSLKEVYLNHEKLSNPEVEAHLRAFEVMRLGFDLAYLEEKLKENEVLNKFQKMRKLGFMDSWWKIFFKTNPQNGILVFKDLSEDNIKKLYPSQAYKINSEVNFELRKGEF